MEKGFKIDSRYEIIEKIGSSPTANVFKVKDLRSENKYALKIFKENDGYTTKNFSPEMMYKITQIKHHNLIPVHSFGHFEDELYYVSELHTGKTLKNYIFEPEKIDFLYGIIVQACYGLDALHTLGVIHRDIKLQNMMFNVKGNKPDLKILDFGFSFFNKKTKSRGLTGTVLYLAPEILLKKDATPLSDFYSLGVSLYYMTTKSLPFTLKQVINFSKDEKKVVLAKPPLEINKKIPRSLSNLIMRLLEANPRNRFQNGKEIISYINKCHYKKYPVSINNSIKDQINFCSYFVRNNYVKKMLNFVELIKNSNGKIVFLSGPKGVGKNQALSLFKYHLLSSKYFIFDYNTTEENKDPFYSLVKESHTALIDNYKIKQDIDPHLKSILKFGDVDFRSEKFKCDLQQQFSYINDYLIKISEIKPLIFLIRHGELLQKETIDFLNFIQNKVFSNRILIAVSTSNPFMPKKVKFAVKYQLPGLDLSQIRRYTETLLQQETSDSFAKKLLVRTNGNPYYTKEFLIHLADQTDFFRNGQFDLEFPIEEEKLPLKLRMDILKRTENLPENYSKYFKLISILNFSFSLDIISDSLNIKDFELHKFLSFATDKKIFSLDKKNYRFTFNEIRDYFFNKIPENEKFEQYRNISCCFENKKIDDIPILEGLIKINQSIDNYVLVKKYILHLLEISKKNKFSDNELELIKQVIHINFTHIKNLSDEDSIHDLTILREQTEITGKFDETLNFLDNYDIHPKFYKNYLIGQINREIEHYKDAEVAFLNSLKYASKNDDIVYSLIELLWLYIIQQDDKKIKDIHRKINNYNLNNLALLKFNTRYEIFQHNKGNTNQAINRLENFLSDIVVEDNFEFKKEMGKIYNNLAYLYSDLNLLEKAQKHYFTAEKIWNSIGFVNSLCTVFNNIGDIHLRRGNLIEAEEYFHKALAIADRIDNNQNKSLSYVNLGEVSIKNGEFSDAKSYLETAKKYTNLAEEKKFLKSIISNLALVKIKIGSFNEYFSFLKEIHPELLEGKILSIDPFIKTYFYFLFSIGAVKKIQSLMNTNPNLDYAELNEDEFFLQIQGLIAYNEKDYIEALEFFSKAEKAAHEKESKFAKAIITIQKLKCYIELGDTYEAIILYKKAITLVNKYNYHYWQKTLAFLKNKIDLIQGEIFYRGILRNLFSLLDSIANKEFYQLKIEILYLITQIYNITRNHKKSEKIFNDLKAYIDKTADELPQECLYDLKKKFCYNLDVKKIPNPPYKKIKNITNYFWENQIFSLLQINDIDRIKFYIEKLITKVFSPHKFAIIILKDLNKNKKSFFNKNFSKKELDDKKLIDTIKKSINDEKICSYYNSVNTHNCLSIPLASGNVNLGALVISDSGELEFNNREIKQLNRIRLHLTHLLVKTIEHNKLATEKKQITYLLSTTQDFFKLENISAVEERAITYCIDFTNATRGFFIKQDLDSNFINTITIDKINRHKKDHNLIKSVINDVIKNKRPFNTTNIQNESLMVDAISVHNYAIHSIYCAPIIINNAIHGIIYLDDYKSEKKLDIKMDLMDILINQITAAIRNLKNFEDIKNRNIQISNFEQRKKKFIGIISHELNTPLGKLSHSIKKCFKDVGQKTDKMRKSQKNIQKKINKMQIIIKELITFNKYLNADSIPTSLQNPIDILKVIVEEAELITKIQKRKLKFEIERYEIIPEIQINWESFHLMLYNIILNSIRFTKDYKTIIVGIRKSNFFEEEIREKESIVIFVQDSGSGIPERDLANVGSTFYEAKNILSHRSGTVDYLSSGLGIGLNVAKRIAELHNGKIHISSKENLGTTVKIILPIPSKESDDEQ